MVLISAIRRALRRFSRNGRGSTAVEFALIAPMFFALIFAILETALMFFAGQILEIGTQDTARLIFTNQAQGGAVAEPVPRHSMHARQCADELLQPFMSM